MIEVDRTNIVALPVFKSTLGGSALKLNEVEAPYATWCRYCYYKYYFQGVMKHDYWLFAQEFKMGGLV